MGLFSSFLNSSNGVIFKSSFCISCDPTRGNIFIARLLYKKACRGTLSILGGANRGAFFISIPRRGTTRLGGYGHATMNVVGGVGNRGVGSDICAKVALG